jgi:mRNA interferase HigB
MMRIIKRAALVRFWSKWPAAQGPLIEWHDKVRRATWSSFVDVRATFGQTDQVRVASGRPVAVFDIGGNKFRLIAAIHYNKQIVYVLRILTHREYDDQKWKRDL